MMEDRFLAARGHVASRRMIVRFWVLVLAVLVYAMVLVGGATRLTDSGLSITDWRPIMGSVPPLSVADWNSLFDLYRDTAEYQLQNKGMSLEEFQYIYWWEWGHRFFGRVIGLVAFIGLGAFLLLGWVKAAFARRMGLIIGLGAVQAVIGMWMVASGLGESTRVDVAPYRLMTHFTLALLIIALLFWTWLDFGRRSMVQVQGAGGWSVALMGLIALQMAAGALVAGLDAGRTYTDWPTMDGSMLPQGYWASEAGWRNFFENTATTQFNHRILAYTLLVLSAVTLVRFWRTDARSRFLIVFCFVLAQTIWGIVTLINAAPLPFALGHQALGVLLLLASVHATWSSYPSDIRSGQPAAA